MSNNYGPRIVTDGLICCLDAADLNSYPGTGTTITDLSGNSNNAILYNSPVINNGIVTLSSTNDYLEIPKVLQVGTVDFWFNSPSSGSAPVITAGSNSWNSSLWQWSMFYYTPNNALFIRPNAGGGGYNIISHVSLNSWHHFVMTRSTTGYSKAWINGTNVISDMSSAPTVTGYLRIGRAGSIYWNGSFGSLRLYSQELSGDQIRQNYEATKGRFGL